MKQQAQLADLHDAILGVAARVEESKHALWIEHEPASPLAGAAISGLDLPALYWISWVATTAAGHALRAGVVHGGWTPGVVFQDRGGRTRIGDFGVARAYESVFGLDRRRGIGLDAERREVDGQPCSGAWYITSAEDRVARGWIAPFFSHELLDGRLPLNVKADPFALGAMLYLLSTGRHPYHIGWDDPTVNLYYTLEPVEPRELRADWNGRASAAFAGDAEKARFQRWSDLLRRLCASEPSRRFHDADELLSAAAALIEPSWAAAVKLSATGLRELEAGRPRDFLAAVSPLLADPSIPEAWRSRLAPLVHEIEEKRREIEARAEADRSLAEARRATDDMDLSRAARLAKAVASSPRAEADQKLAAEQIIRRCDELNEFVASGADQFARTYLESAAESLSRGDAADARQILQFVLSDPGTPPPRLEQARRALADVELLEASYERQAAELAAAERERADGQYEAAETRLAQLLEEPQPNPQTAGSAAAALETVRRLQRQRATHMEELERGRQAWERAEDAELAAALDHVPADSADPKVADLRRTYVERLLTLRAAQAVLEEARRATERERFEDALRTLAQVRPHAELPRNVRSALDAVAQDCNERLKEKRAEAIARALQSLEAAQREYDRGEESAAAARIERDVLSEPGIPPGARARADDLLTACRSAVETRRRLAQADDLLGRGDLAGASRVSQELVTTDLPPALTNAVRDFDGRLAAAREQALAGERKTFSARLAAARDALQQGRLDEAAAAIASGQPRAELGGELLDQWRALQKSFNLARQCTAVLANARDVLSRTDGERLCEETLRTLPPGAPGWAIRRADELRAEAARLAEQARAARIAQTVAALDRAAGALEEGDASAARQALDEARAVSSVEPKLKGRFEQLAEQTERLERWLPQVEALRDRFDAGDWLSLRAPLASLAAEPTLPEMLRRRVKALDEAAELEVAKRRQTLEQSVRKLEAELSGLSHQQASHRARLATVERDPLADDRLREHVGELLHRHDALPQPPSRLWPLFGSAAAIVATGVGAYFWLRRPQPGPTPVIPTPSNGSTTQQAANPPPGPPPIEPKVTQTQPAPPALTEERLAEYAAAVRDALGADVAPIATASGSDVRIAARYRQHDLLAPTNVRWDAELSAITPEPATAAAYLRQQVDALDLLAAGNTAIRLDDRYDSRLTWKDAPAAIQLTAVESQGVRIRGAARLSDDPRPDESFRLDGLLANGACEAASESVTAFRNYLNRLQTARIQQLTLADWPRDVRVATPADFTGGDQATLRLIGPNNAPAGAIELQWDAGKLAYEPAAAALRSSRSAALRVSLSAAQTLARLRDQWKNTIRGSLLPEGQRGRAFAATCEIREIAAASDVADAPAIDASVRMAPAGAGTESETKLAVRLVLRDGELAWPAADDADFQARVAAGLAGLEQSRAFRDARKAALLSDEARQAGVAPAALKLEQGESADEFAVTVGEPATSRIRAAWNSDTLRYEVAERTAMKPPPPADVDSAFSAVLNDRQIADVSAQELAGLLSIAARQKLERYGVAEYQPIAGLADPASANPAGLLQVAQGVQRLVAPNPSSERYPNCFVEYVVGATNVYGVSWRAETGPGSDNVSSSSSPRVWTVMPTASLAAAANPAGVRQLFQDPAMGEKLLGPVLGDAIEGTTQSEAGSFGVAIAPDGALWLVRWDQVRFRSRPVRNIANLSAAARPNQVDSLRDLLSYTQVDRTGLEFRRAGLWCFPSLAATWRGAAPPRLNTGLPGANAQLRFVRAGVNRSLLAARVEDEAVTDRAWTDLSTRLAPTNVGYLFWNDGWTSPRDWSPRNTTSLSLILSE